jgi:hypothetical protein
MGQHRLGGGDMQISENAKPLPFLGQETDPPEIHQLRLIGTKVTKSPRCSSETQAALFGFQRQMGQEG